MSYATKLLYGPIVQGPQGTGSYASTPFARVKLDGANHASAQIFSVPHDGTITHIGFLCSGIGGNPPAYNVGIVTLDANGLPTTTAYGGSTNTTYDFTSTSLHWIALPVAATANAGDLAAVHIWDAVPAPDAANYVYVVSDNNLGGYYTTLPRRAYKTGFGYAQPEGMMPGYAIRYSDGEECLHPAIAYTGDFFDSTSTPDEVGCLIDLPFGGTVYGCRVGFNAMEVGSSLEARLYDLSGTLVASTVVSSQYYINAGWDYSEADLYWEPVSVLAGTYRLTVLATAAGNRLWLFGFEYDNATGRSAVTEGARWQKTERTDLGAWTDTATELPWMGLWFSEIGDPDAPEQVTYLPKIWTHHRSVNLPISLWRPYFDPSTFTFNPKSSYVTTIHDAEDYSHKISATGGYWESSFTIKGSAEIADEWLDEGLGRHVEVHDEAGVLIWEGFVNEINVSSGGFSVSAGPLTEVANRIYTHYEELDTTTNPPTNNGPMVAGPYTDTDSIEKYGVWEKVFRAGELTTTEAEQVAQLYLEKYSWPQLSKDVELGSEQSSEVSIDIDCVGYVRRLDYPYTQSILSGGIDLSDKIGMILTYDNTINNLFSVVNSEIAANTFQVQNYEDQYRLAWELLKQLVDEGDLALNRYMIGVYKNRRFFYAQIPEVISYQQHLTDPNQRIENMSGMEIMPWNVLPGKWLIFPDFMVGRVPPGLPLNKDPRVMYIEEVSYKTPYSVTLSQTPVDKVTTRIQQLSLRNQAW